MDSSANCIRDLLANQSRQPQKTSGQAFAPANVALCKYWGKRDNHLNLPVTNSLSVSLGLYGAKTVITPIDADQDSIWLNGIELNNDSATATATATVTATQPSVILAQTGISEMPYNEPLHTSYNTSAKSDSFIQRLVSFLDMFRGNDLKQNKHGKLHTVSSIDRIHFRIDTQTNIPVAAGLASSAAGFAALVLALADLYNWDLDLSAYSIMSRLGSGSACRSLWQGFVEWEKGVAPEGNDSFARLVNADWYDFRVGLLIMNADQKSISSRQAMKNTMATSEFYQHWPERVAFDLQRIKTAIELRDFDLLGETAESNALCMHALMQTARPPIIFNEAMTLASQHKIWQLRKAGLRLYFTQDAGPNLKLLYLAEDESKVRNLFPGLVSIAPMLRDGNIRNSDAMLTLPLGLRESQV